MRRVHAPQFRRMIAFRLSGQVTRMTLRVVAHFSDQERQAILDSYPPHERDARAPRMPLPLPNARAVCPSSGPLPPGNAGPGGRAERRDSMSGFADRQPQMPPMGPPSGIGGPEPAAGNILTSGLYAAEPERLAQTTAPALSPPPKAVPAAAPAPLSPTEREQLFQQYLQNLAPREGGTSNRPVTVDRGGLTHEGVSTKFLDSYRRQNPQLNLPADPRNLTVKQRTDIARAEFFDRARVAEVAAIPGVIQQVPQLPEQLFDSGFLHGPEDAGKFLQKALDRVLGSDLRSMIKGQIGYDGIVGSKTRATIAEAVRQNRLREVNNEMLKEREQHMRSQPEFPANRGWITRAQSFYAK